MFLFVATGRSLGSVGSGAAEDWSSGACATSRLVCGVSSPLIGPLQPASKNPNDAAARPSVCSECILPVCKRIMNLPYIPPASEWRLAAMLSFRPRPEASYPLSFSSVGGGDLASPWPVGFQSELLGRSTTTFSAINFSSAPLPSRQAPQRRGNIEPSDAPATGAALALAALVDHGRPAPRFDEPRRDQPDDAGR